MNKKEKKSIARIAKNVLVWRNKVTTVIVNARTIKI